VDGRNITPGPRTVQKQYVLKDALLVMEFVQHPTLASVMPDELVATARQMWTNVLQTMVDVIKYALIILVHISVVAIKDTSQMGNAAKTLTSACR